MIRELTMNAIEAASRASGEKIVHWTSGTYNGVRKAMIWNTGPGMDPAELKAATNLACVINKSLGLDENFGVGAKVSALANNRLGMRFRSCKGGRVSQVVLGYDEEQKLYVRFEIELPSGVRDTVIDVTEAAVKEGRDVTYDWTDVMLLGNSTDQDTTERPLAAQPTTEKAYREFNLSPLLPTAIGCKATVRRSLSSVRRDTKLDANRSTVPQICSV
jgi:hypothetical protein